MTATALLLIGHGTDDAAGLAEYHQLATMVQQRLDCFVQPCFLELADPPIGQAIDQCARAGYQRIVALPLLLGAAGHQKNDIPVALRQARLRWPDLTIQYSAPLGVQYPLLKALSDRLAAVEAAAPPFPRAETALAVIGRGSSDPDSNADVARMARLLWEGRGYALGVGEVKLTGMVRPDRKMLRYYVDFTKAVQTRRLTMGVADGRVEADGEVIYQVKDMKVALSES